MTTIVGAVVQGMEVGKIWTWDDVVAHNPAWALVLALTVGVFLGFAGEMFGWKRRK